MNYLLNIDYPFHQVTLPCFLLTADYADTTKPSISLSGVLPGTFGDTATPPSGRGVLATDLNDLDARRRFGKFGSTFVELERLRQSRSMDKSGSTAAARKTGVAYNVERDSIYEQYSVTRQYIRMYNVIS